MDKKHHITLSENHKLFYHVYGNGENTVILLHGLVGGSWLGDDWIHSIVQNNIRCIVPERPGYGTSSPILLQSVSDWIPIIQALGQKDYIEQMKAASQRMERTNLLHIKNTLQEVLAQQCFGMAQESRLQILPWNLPLTEIKQPVILFHTPSDEMVPFAAAQDMLPYFTYGEFHEINTLHLSPDQSPHMSAITQRFHGIINSNDFL